VFTPAEARPGTGEAAGQPPESLARFVRAFFEGAGPTLTTLLNRPVTVTVRVIEPLVPKEVAGRIPLPCVLVEARYQRGLEGGHWIAIGLTGALLVGHALVGEAEGEALEFTSAHADAVAEMMNQLLGATASSLKPVLGRSVAFEPVSLSVVEDASGLPAAVSLGKERLWLVRTEATAPDGFRAELVLVVGLDLVREIVSVAEQAGAAAPAEAQGLVGAPSGIDLILDVTLPVSVELGRSRMQIQDILRLAPGSIIELDKSAGDAVEILINDRPIAKGEVVVIDENFGVRLTSIVTTAERIRTLR
jgi:flagellar motor switch protein FliN/FliY